MLHVGDTEASASDFSALRLADDRIDVGLIPFWHLLSDDGRRKIAETVAPGSVVAIHIPPESARDAWIEQELGGWRELTETILEGQADAIALTEPLERYRF